MKTTSLTQILEHFEQGLDPANPGASDVKFFILGYGEISTVFTMEEAPDSAFKRMPLFRTPDEIRDYGIIYRKYCAYLEEAGVKLPDSSLAEVSIEGRPGVLYIIQERHDPSGFCHTLIHGSSEEEVKNILVRVCEIINRVWNFNASQQEVQLAIDGQLSNWTFENGIVYYVDTSTPLFRINGKEQMDPALILNTAPGFLRWILRLFFLDDVMDRYYDPRSVFIDLVANLHKEQRPDLILPALTVVNNYLQEGIRPITEKDIHNYYREDRIIWALFLIFRKFDRWLTTKILGKRYEFILPGKIKR